LRKVIYLFFGFVVKISIRGYGSFRGYVAESSYAFVYPTLSYRNYPGWLLVDTPRVMAWERRVVTIPRHDMDLGLRLHSEIFMYKPV
tara:strand:+ start:12548 stop:12808 length:261 start_codon:yes stop_codon:yes gene_type:complete